MCAFPDIESAILATVQTLQSGVPMAKIEFLDELSVKAANMYFNLDFPLAPTLFLEFTGSPQSIEEQRMIVSK